MWRIFGNVYLYKSKFQWLISEVGIKNYLLKCEVRDNWFKRLRFGDFKVTLPN